MRTYTLDGKKLPLKGDAQESCETCRFWRNVKRESLAETECRRHAPIAVHFAQTQYGEDDFGARGNNVAIFPITFSDDWCGEYERAAT